MAMQLARFSVAAPAPNRAPQKRTGISTGDADGDAAGRQQTYFCVVNATAAAATAVRRPRYETGVLSLLVLPLPHRYNNLPLIGSGTVPMIGR